MHHMRLHLEIFHCVLKKGLSSIREVVEEINIINVNTKERIAISEKAPVLLKENVINVVLWINAQSI